MSSSSAATGLLYQIVIPVLLLAAAAGAYFGIGVRRESPTREAQEEGPPLVETAAVEAYRSAFHLESDGQVVPYREIALAAEVAGKVLQKNENCKSGRFVRKGTPLLTIDPADFQLDVDRLTREQNQADDLLQELDVEERNAQNLLKIASEQLVLQEREAKRLEGLRGRNVVTDSEYDKARREVLTAQNAVQNVENQLQLVRTKRHRLTEAQAWAASMLKKAELDLQRTKIAAPVSGVVLQSDVEEQTWVQKGTLLVKLEDTSAAEVKCSLRMEEVEWLWRSVPTEAQPASATGAPSEAAALRYEAPRVPAKVVYRLGSTEYQWDGFLARFDGLGLDEQTRTIPCRVLVPDPLRVTPVAASGTAAQASPVGPQALVRGMFVTVRFQIQPREPLLRLPERAVRQVGAGESGLQAREGNSNVVWRVRSGKLDAVPVQVIRADAGQVLVSAQSGLTAGDKVVVTPLADARRGQAVREGAAEAK